MPRSILNNPLQHSRHRSRDCRLGYFYSGMIRQFRQKSAICRLDSRDGMRLHFDAVICEDAEGFGHLQRRDALLQAAKR
ncbi:hypothetical protein D3C78_1474360 [compost metagenome]